jgi:hypothetical protein
MWAGQRSRYSDWLLAGRYGDRIPVGARFSAPVQTGPGTHPASCTMGTGSFPGVKSDRHVMLAPHPLLVPWSWKGRAILLLPLWAVRPVQRLSACKRVHFIVVHAFLATDFTAYSNLSVAINGGKWNCSGNRSLVQYKNWAWNLGTRPEEKRQIALDDRI